MKDIWNLSEALNDETAATEVNIWDVGETVPDSLWLSRQQAGELEGETAIFAEVIAAIEETLVGGEFEAREAPDQLPEIAARVVEDWDDGAKIETGFAIPPDEWATEIRTIGTEVTVESVDISDSHSISAVLTAGLYSYEDEAKGGEPIEHPGDYAWPDDPIPPPGPRIPPADVKPEEDEEDEEKAERPQYGQIIGKGLRFTSYESRFVATKDGEDYHSIIFPFRYTLPDPVLRKYKQMFVRIELNENEAEATDFLPRQLHDHQTLETEWTVSGGLEYTPISATASATWKVKLPVVVPRISTFGIWDNWFGWQFHPTILQEGTHIATGIESGDRFCGVILRTPQGLGEVTGKIAYDFSKKEREKGNWLDKNATTGSIETITWELPESGYVRPRLVPPNAYRRR